MPAPTEKVRAVSLRAEPNVDALRAAARRPVSVPLARHRHRTAGVALAAFLVLAYALSWSWTLPFAVAGDVIQKGIGWPTHQPALFGPALAALAVTAWLSGRAGLVDERSHRHLVMVRIAPIRPREAETRRS